MKTQFDVAISGWRQGKLLSFELTLPVMLSLLET